MLEPFQLYKKGDAAPHPPPRSDEFWRGPEDDATVQGERDTFRSPTFVEGTDQALDD